MKRTIKFRAWEKKKNKFHIGTSLFLNGNGYLFKNNRDGMEGTDDLVGGMDEFIVMQYTGLKDKNGVEIYEGDIVKGGNAVWAVEWIASIAGFNIQNETHEYSEIIGNIYENPELLSKN